ncbi:MAG: peptidoglycan editing factor PgeF [Gammaproteobacteria bacterium]|nr:peptidoglycan editing factor PgeF [Gammaproteobacteria bacterium]
MITPHWPAPAHVRAYTTTRKGGVSQGPYAQLNLSSQVGDDPNAVNTNRHLLRQHLSLPNDPIWLHQAHTVHVLCIDEKTSSSADDPHDASYTQRRAQVCAVLTADCLPLLLCNKTGTLVAAIHAGWRGLAAGVIEHTLQQLPAKSDELLVWLGPAMGPQAFELGPEAKESLLTHAPAGSEAAFRPASPGKWWGDMYELARIRLRAQGVRAIYGGDYCTYTQSDLFYSYRRDKTTGRMASLIYLH